MSRPYATGLERFRAVLLALGLWLLTACDTTSTQAFQEPVSGRPYQVIAPDALDVQGRPVLFALHAYGTDPGLIVDRYALVRHVVRDRGWLLVVPEGRLDALGRRHWNATRACCGEGRSPDDLAYLRAVLDDVRQRYPIDLQRVYALGVSNGGFMAHRWACHSAGELAGFISIAGAATGRGEPVCAPQRSVTLVEVHGTQDDVIKYEGSDAESGDYPGAMQSAARWVALNAIRSRPQLSRRRTWFFEPLRVETWRSSSARVSLWTVEGGDHLLRSMRLHISELLSLLSG